MKENRCIVCNEIIPEGLQVCPNCNRKGSNMKADVIEQYVKDRNEMLKKCSVLEFRKFVNAHSRQYSAEYLSAFNAAPDEVLKISLHKMIVNVPSLPKELREKSAFWLILHGYDLNVN